MGIKSTFEKLTRSSSSTISNNDTFNYLQRQTEIQYNDTEVLVKAYESYAKLLNKKSKPPSNLKVQDNLKGVKRLPIELLSIASFQYSLSLNESSHLKKAYVEYSDSHRRIIDKQKNFSGDLGSYIVYLGENIEDYKRYNSLKGIYSKNMKTFSSYQNKLKKQSTPVTNEQNTKLKSYYEAYQNSLRDLSEKMAELTSNRKEDERFNQFSNIINCEIQYYQEVTNNLKFIKETIEKNKAMETENKYSENKSIKEFVDEIMENKLELENFNVQNGGANSISSYPKINEKDEIQYESNSTDTYQRNYINNVQNQNKEQFNNYQESNKLLMSNENDYNYNEYNENKYYNDSNNQSSNDFNNLINEYSKELQEQANDIQDSSYNNSYSYNNYNEKKKEKEDNIDDYLMINRVNNSGSDGIKNNYPLESPVSPLSNSNSVRSSIVFNKENIILINGKESVNKASSMCDKIYNTKELDPNKCKAIYAFKKTLDDELELETNDLIVITKKFDDGWATGKNLRSNLEGFFPLNCLLEFYVTDKFAKYGGSKENSESYAYSTLPSSTSSK